MEEYRVPKQQASVLINLPPHPPQARHVFLSAFAQSHHGAETPSDIFFVRQPFVPLYREGGDLVLARRDAIVWVMVSDPRRTEWLYYESRADVPEEPVHIEFEDRTHLDGRVALIGPVGGQRILDILNNRVEGFLHVERDEELFLVNLKRVVSFSLKG